jgi:hypothetical protein
MQLPSSPCASILAFALALALAGRVAAQGSSSSTVVTQECTTEITACDNACLTCLASVGGPPSSSSGGDFDCFGVSVISDIQTANCPTNSEVSDLITCMSTALDCTSIDSAVCTGELAACILDGTCVDCLEAAYPDPPSGVLSGSDCEALSAAEEALNGAPECTGAVSLFNDITTCISAAHEDGGCQAITDGASLASAFSAVALAITMAVAVAMN